MGFTQTFFIFIFFPISIGLFYLLHFAEEKLSAIKKLRTKDILLIVLSLLFYNVGGTNSIKGLGAVAGYIFLVYCFGKLIDGAKGLEKNSRSLVLVGTVILVSILFYYKYITFVTSAIYEVTGIMCIVDVIWVPLGISFVTFSAISYIVDIYRRDAYAGSIIDTFLYLSLFTKVVSGPIVLWKDFAPQINERSISVDGFVSGINRIMIGFAKKLILADYFGIVVADIQGEVPFGIDVPTGWICAILYTLQIYYDFAGYSDIAIGISRLYGYSFKNNFNFPYTSTSITEFWRNWHISLGTWFREYLYIPLGGNRKGKRRTLINLGIVFLVTGIWHGAGYNYIFWGMLHGAFILIERCSKDKALYKKTPKFIKWFVTMFVVNIGWEAFRIQSISELFGFYKLLFGFGNAGEIFFTWDYFLSPKLIFFAVIGILGATLLKGDFFSEVNSRLEQTRSGFVLKEITLFLLMLISVFCMVSSTYSPFIYFQY